MEKHYATIWEAISDELPDREALVQGVVRRTWREFDDRSARLASAMLEAGLTAGSKVGQLLYNAPEFMESYFAALKIRAVPFNLNYRYVEDELVYLLENSDAEALVFHASLRDQVASALRRLPQLKLVIEVPDEAPAGDPVDGAERYDDLIARHSPAARIVRDGNDITMCFTGGTTGMPKAVMMPIAPAIDELLATTPPLFGEPPESDLDAALASIIRLSDEGRQYATLPASPLIHNAALGMSANPALLFGGRVVLLEGRTFDADELWDVVERERVGSILIVGDAFARPMLHAANAKPGRDLSSVVLIASTGAMFATEVKTGLFEHVPDAVIVDVISATEGSMGVAISAKDAPVPTGTFMPYAGVVVFDDGDQVVEPGSDVAGRVAIPCGDQGYFKDDAKTAQTFRTINGQRYSFPGDYARVRADGSLTLLGRGSSCVNTAGEKVYPEEVEEVLKSYPGIEDCLVFGVADERVGQRVTAVVSAQPGVASVDLEALTAHARTRLASYKIPRTVEVVSWVPRTSTGKANYPEARRMVESTIVP